MRREPEITTKENCYLYSMWSGNLREYKGRVIHKTQYQDSYIYPARTKFQAVNEYGETYKNFDCSNKECEIYNKVVWLSESDINKAIDMFIRYEQARISKLQDEISGHLDIIETLKQIKMD